MHCLTLTTAGRYIFFITNKNLYQIQRSICYTVLVAMDLISAADAYHISDIFNYFLFKRYLHKNPRWNRQKMFFTASCFLSEFQTDSFLNTKVRPHHTLPHIMKILMFWPMREMYLQCVYCPSTKLFSKLFSLIGQDIKVFVVSLISWRYGEVFFIIHRTAALKDLSMINKYYGAFLIIDKTFAIFLMWARDINMRHNFTLRSTDISAS